MDDVASTCSSSTSTSTSSTLRTPPPLRKNALLRQSREASMSVANLAQGLPVVVKVSGVWKKRYSFFFFAPALLKPFLFFPKNENSF